MDMPMGETKYESFSQLSSAHSKQRARQDHLAMASQAVKELHPEGKLRVKQILVMEWESSGLPYFHRNRSIDS